MTLFRIILGTLFIWMVGYTGLVLAEYGPNLFPIFFGDIADLNWRGQFNTDFMSFLVLSGLWTAWRNQFSPAGIGLGVLAFFGGAVFLTAYLFILSFKTDGNWQKIFMGDRAA